MCGRYHNIIAREAYRLLFRAERLPQSNFPPRYNIAPTDSIPIVRVDPRDSTAERKLSRRFAELSRKHRLDDLDAVIAQARQRIQSRK
jgi:putative SOS response-associated peptidase YedK